MRQWIYPALIVLSSLMTGMHLQAQKVGMGLIDSLNTELLRCKEDTCRMKILTAMGIAFRYVNPNLGIEISQQATELATKARNPYYEALSHYSLASNYAFKNMILEALDHSHISDSISMSHNYYELATANLLNLAYLYLGFDSASTKQILAKAGNLFSRNKDPRWIVNNLGALTLCYRNLGETDSAAKYLKRYLYLLEKNGDRFQQMLNLSRQGGALLESESYDSAYYVLTKALPYFDSIGAYSTTGYIENLLGWVRAAQARQEKGARKLSLSQEAMTYLIRAFGTASEIHDMITLYNSSRVLSDLYAEYGDTVRAYRYLKKAQTFGYSLEQRNVISRAVNMTSHYERRIKDQELALLQLRSRQQWIVSLLLASGVLVLIGVMIILVKSRKKIRRTFRLVKAQKSEIAKVLGELAKSNQGLEAANSELESFSYSVSHDLRAPVRRIGELSGILREDAGGQLDDMNRDILDRIERSANQMNALIEDLLKLARITRMQINRKPCDLSGICEAISKELKTVYTDYPVKCTVQPGMRVDADPGLLTIALQNLMDNAFKYSGRNENPVVSVSSDTRDGKTFIVVSDNGAGFDMNKAGRLFTPFQRMHSEEEFKGTGVGLATVKRIITRHGGMISVQSEPGKGTTFSFSFE